MGAVTSCANGICGIGNAEATAEGSTLACVVGSTAPGADPWAECGSAGAELAAGSAHPTCDRECSGPGTETTASGDPPTTLRTPGAAPRAQSTNSRKPRPSATQRVAAKVRAQAAKGLEDAWEAVVREFEVQKKVWESVALGQGPRHHGQVAMLESKIEIAVGHHGQDPGFSMQALEAVLQRDAQGRQMLGRDMAQSVRHAILAHKQAAVCLELAESLQGKALGTSDGAAALEQMLAQCGLDPELEEAIRKVLNHRKL